MTKKAAYVAIDTGLEGKKNVLGSWLGANESSKYGFNVLTGYVSYKDVKAFFG